MYQLWDKIVEPALLASGATRVVEIGALRGETTVRLLELLGPDSEVHVIDPLPMFDPEEHARRFPGRYVFHRDISHNVLPELPPVDAAIVDGDHNWFSVYHELCMLRETARAAGRPLPLLVLHDVCWPYGRRDLYYEPQRIPEEFRRPYAARGIVPGNPGLVDGAGLNQHLANAMEEGGPRNGVRTALDDFAAEHDRAVRLVVLPIYFGLALLADEERLAASPALVQFLDRLDGAEARGELLELAESIRLAEQVHHHNASYEISARARRGARRYLDLLKGALLDEHYLENELRIDYLLERVASAGPLDGKKLRDPARYMAKDLGSLRRAREAGEMPGGDAKANGDDPVTLAYTAIGRNRLDHLERCLDTIADEAVGGDLVDCGAGRGGSSVFLRGYLEAYELPSARVWVADRFGEGELPADDETASFTSDLNLVREGFSRFGLLDGRVNFLDGPFASTLQRADIAAVALLRVDSHDPDEVVGVLEALYDKVSPGGYVVVDDYGDSDCQAAVDAFRERRGISQTLERIDWSGAFWRTPVLDTEALSGAGPQVSVPAPGHGAVATKDLSVVVVFHNMRREAQRTLHSLSRRYQKGVDDLDYEVVVVENGSDPDQRLGEELVRSFGLEFRYVDMGDDAAPSPARALNRGIEFAGGRALALMIDGAHVLTPGVLMNGMLGLASYEPALVTTQQWYVGPGEQNETVAKGYNRDYEDRLFEEIAWPTDGYGLFDIGHFIGNRDWFEDQWESNCVFVRRTLIDQLGGMDERFDEPGGGFVNLDFFERMASSPSVTLVTILGEGSFHQLHGGTTTNVGEATARNELLDSFHDRYAELRGRRFALPRKEFHYVGSLPEPARRTKARRMGAPVYFRLAHVEGTDGRPPNPVPIPAELRTEFIDAFWRSKEWHSTTWLGRWTGKAPTDLLAYQDLLFRVRPDWVVETGSGGGGRALFLASVFELMGAGQVLSIDDTPVERLVEHPRITYIRRDPTDEEAVAAARETLGERPRVLLILGAAKRDKLLATFDLYSPLVPVGSYAVFEDTILNGHPVWAGFGPGPWEAVGDISKRGEFVIDQTLERYGLTFNPNGFLKRER